MYRLATEKDIPGIIALWQEAFHETPILPDGVCYVAQLDGQVAAMLHALPQTLRLGRDYKAYYLYAVATKKAYRGQGLCRNLMAYAEAQLPADCCILVPATESLFGFYEALGYRTAFTRNKTSFRGGEEISMEDYLTLREELLRRTPHVVYHDLSYPQRLYDLKFYKTSTGICAASDRFTAERLPEDLGTAPCGMIKWRAAGEEVCGAYLGFTLE